MFLHFSKALGQNLLRPNKLSLNQEEYIWIHAGRLTANGDFSMAI